MACGAKEVPGDRIVHGRRYFPIARWAPLPNCGKRANAWPLSLSIDDFLSRHESCFVAYEFL